MENKKDYLNRLAAAAFEYCGAVGWRLKFGVDNECIPEMRTIYLSTRALESEPWYYLKEMLLHEAAHIGETRPGSWQTHDAGFFLRLGELCIRFSSYEPNRPICVKTAKSNGV